MFHISTAAYQQQKYGKRYDFGPLEERLDALGFQLVFCVRTAESFGQAREERLKVSGNPSQYDDLSLFVRKQDLMRELMGRSRLPVLELDVSDGNIAAACERIADRLEATGRLWAR